MLQAPTSDRKTKAEASSKTAEYLPEYEPSSQSIGGMGRSRQSHPLQQRENLAALQKAYGNQAVLRMKGRSTAANPEQKGVLQRKCACGNSAGSSGSCAECQSKQEGILQTKLQIGEAGDRYEQEADRVAEQVMRMPEPTIQRQVETEAIAKSITPLQRYSTDRDQPSEVPPIVHEVLQSPGQSLDPATRALMEPRFGWNFSRVRIHNGSNADEATDAVKAQAFTLNHDIVFGAGQYDLHSTKGRDLLAHELAHVVQQESNLPSAVIQRQLYPPIPIVVKTCPLQRIQSGKAIPNVGIEVTWQGNQINIRARLQFSGPRATQQVANAMKQDIEQFWNAKFPDGYAATCQVDTQLGGAKDPGRSQIIVGIGVSVTESHTFGSTMYFVYSGTPSDLVWSPAHEFAHLLGLLDRRSTPWWDIFNTQPEKSDPGYEKNIMGAIPGGDPARKTELVVESRNIRDWLNKFATQRVCNDTTASFEGDNSPAEVSDEEATV